MAWLKQVFPVLLLLAALSAFGLPAPKQQAKPAPFSLTLSPGMSLPLGRDRGVYALGGGGELSAAYRLAFLPALYVGASAGYSYVPLESVTSVSLVEGGLDAGLHIDILRRLSLRIYGTGGYFYAALNDGSAPGEGNPFTQAGMRIGYAIIPAIDLGLGASYRYFFGLYNDLSLSLGLSYKFPTTASKGSSPAEKKKPAIAKPKPTNPPTPAKPKSAPKSLGWEEAE
jgi:hypothetical protein